MVMQALQHEDSPDEQKAHHLLQKELVNYVPYGTEYKKHSSLKSAFLIMQFVEYHRKDNRIYS